MEELKKQFKAWLEKRNGSSVIELETIIAHNKIMFIADGVRWDFNYDYETSLVCDLQKEAICLNDIVEPNIINEVLFFDKNANKYMLVDLVNNGSVDEKILAKYYFDTSIVNSFVANTIKAVLGADRLKNLKGTVAYS